MKYDYKKIIEDNQTIDDTFIKNLNALYAAYPNAKILLEIFSTKYLSSETLRQLPESIAIRVSGGYDEERVKRYANVIYNDGETGAYYYEAVIYSRNELIKIVEEIEKIESKFHKNWSDIQKIVYTYDKLKREIMYDPKYKYKPSSKISSLRGLVTKQTVCAGYSLIFKEIMDRNDIDCEYVEGYTKKDATEGHAWNIINLGNKKYPIDLTKDNSSFRSGKLSSINSFTEDIKTFSNCHFPYKEEKKQNYLQTLSQMDSHIIDLIIEQNSKSREYEKPIYHGTRNDGSHFMVTEIGNVQTEDTEYFRYCYVEILPNGEIAPPVVLYSENNLTVLMYGKLHGRKVPYNYENAINNVLFSKENILDSLTRKTFYIGRVDKKSNENKWEFMISYKEIIKPESISKIFSLPTKIFTRSNGTTFIIQKIPQESPDINDFKVTRYDIIEIITKQDKKIVKRNTVFTEKELLNDNRQSLIDNYLSRERIDTIVEEMRGYLGYYNENNEIRYNQELISYFKLKRIDIDDIETINNKHR